MEHKVEVIPVTTDRDGSQVTVVVHHIGSGNGPVLTLVGAQHSDEWQTTRYLFDLVNEAKQWKFGGTLRVVPVANAPGWRDLTRITQASADEPDMNRSWPSTRNWLTSQIVGALAERAVAGSSVVVDFHQGLWGSAWGGVCYPMDLPDQSVSLASRKLAFTFGFDCVERLELMKVFPGPRSLGGYCGAVLGVPVIVSEIGGAGFDVADERRWYHDLRRGVRNIMISLGMLDGEVELPERILETGKCTSVTPRFGGLLMPVREPEVVHRKVNEGELLARVINPQRMDVLEKMVAPVAGWLFCVPRYYPVRPGDWAYSIAPAATARWVGQDAADDPTHSGQISPA